MEPSPRGLKSRTGQDPSFALSTAHQAALQPLRSTSAQPENLILRPLEQAVMRGQTAKNVGQRTLHQSFRPEWISCGHGMSLVRCDPAGEALPAELRETCPRRMRLGAGWNFATAQSVDLTIRRAQRAEAIQRPPFLVMSSNWEALHERGWRRAGRWLPTCWMTGRTNSVTPRPRSVPSRTTLSRSDKRTKKIDIVIIEVSMQPASLHCCARAVLVVPMTREQSLKPPVYDYRLQMGWVATAMGASRSHRRTIRGA